LLVVFVALYAPYNDYALNNTFFIGNHFPIGITILMCVLILAVNPVIRLIAPSAGFRSSELAVIWAMCLVGAAFPTTGLVRQWIPWMIAPTYRAPPHPEWKAALEHLPESLFPTDPVPGFPLGDPFDDRVTTNFYLGRDPGDVLDVPWDSWAEPMIKWGIYFIPLYLGVFFAAVLMSRQWIVHEKLPFPIATVMLDMVRDPPPGKRFNSIFTDRRLWVGAAVVMAIHLLNGLHVYFSKVPNIPLTIGISGVATEGIWAFLPSPLKTGAIYFSMVGIAFLMASEVSLSLWAVFVGYGVIGAMMVSTGVSPWASIKSQSYGATLAMGCYLIFLARTHLWRAIRVSFGSIRDEEDGQYKAYRWIVWGMFICFIAPVAWMVWTGLPVVVAVANVAILYLVYLVVSRLVAETGMFFIVPQFGASDLFPTLLPNVLSAKTQALVINSTWLNFFHRETLMPFAFNALRLEHEEGGQSSAGNGALVRKSLTVVLIVTMGLSFAVATYGSLRLYYDRGGIRTNGTMTYSQPESQIKAINQYARMLPPQPGQGPIHMGIGAALMLLLGYCRMRFVKWPLVPIALCMASSSSLGLMWFSILLGWACKTTVMSVGGVTVYNRVRPIFLGMIIGEVLMAGIWMLVGALVSLLGYEAVVMRILPI
jgi:hypothetical protein